MLVAAAGGGAGLAGGRATERLRGRAGAVLHDLLHDVGGVGGDVLVDGLRVVSGFHS